MAMNLVDLERARVAMLAEFERDADSGVLYRSPRLSEAGWRAYPAALRAAITGGDDRSFGAALGVSGFLVSYETSTSRAGKSFSRRVPVTACETLAENEFNHFYLRGACVVALDSGISAIEIYRAKPVRDPRPDSEALIGQRLDPQTLLEDLRRSVGVEAALGLGRPNSGLSGRLLA